ncbi:beta strand repeat-containing protein [Prescottella equi]|uniref:beta strand repeat-containing protein n=1 Tax=Rhodococcus hoagii TaxID=43767 RepID=UPI001C846936|nr:Ig-like domain-containing protein [Prescottella equi]
MSVFAMAAGFAATAGVGSAGAAAASVNWSDGSSAFKRTVSNSTPSVGETISITTDFDRTGGVVEYIQAVKDIHPPCLTYVSGNRSSPEVAADYTRVTGSWPVYPNISPNIQTFTFNYLVTASCARSTPLMTTMHYSGSLGSGTYSDKGPTITVSKDTTTTTLAAVPTPILTGQSVTLTATVTGAAQGNAVEFYDGATKLGEGPISASGVATYAWTPTTAGTRSLTAKFAGTAIANSSQSAAQNVQVNAPAATGTTVSVPGTAVTGTPVTLSASVTPANAVGTVQFKDNGSSIGSPVAVTAGQATLPHTFTTAGAHSITADFVAGSGFVNSSAPAQTVTVNAPTTTTLQVPASATTGAPVTLSASVTPSNAAGTVQFKDNGTAIGSPVAVAAGQASVQHTFGAAGSHSITAEFSGGPGFASSTAAAQTVPVADPDVETSLSVSAPGSATTGVSVDLAATVSPSTAEGSVQFKVNGSPVGASVPVSGGEALLPYTFNAAGSFAVTAEFTGAAGFTNSSASAQSVTVTDPDVTTSLSVTAPESATTGSSVDLSATVNPSNAVGSVQFTDNGAPIGSPVAVVNGVATLSHTFTSAGAHSVGADFVAGAGFTNSSATAQPVTVADPDIATSLTVQVPPTTNSGTELNLVANLTPTNAQGSVQFKVDGDPVGSPVPVSAGAAILPHSFNAAGSFAVTAEFTGAPGFADSTAPAQNVVVSDPDVTTSLSVTAPESATTGSSVDLSATVNPSNAVGTVQFTDNGAPIGSPVAVVNGVAALSHTFTSAGGHSVGADFVAGAGFTNSSATAQPVTVADPDIATSLTVQVPPTTNSGAELNLVANLTPTNAQGSVQFKVDGDPVGSPVPVSAGAAILPHSFNAAGSFAVTAEFTGAPGFADSTAPAQNVVVSDPDVTTSLSVTAPESATTGSSVDLSATVNPSNAVGTVQFTDNGAPIGSPVAVVNGVATLSHTFTSAGAHSVGADFVAGAGFTNSSAAAQSVTVADPDVETSLSVSAPASATTGESVSLSAQVSPVAAQGSVQFRVNGSPAGAAVPVSGGEAVLPYTFNAAGSFAVTAEFTGAPGFADSTAPAQNVVVSDPNVSTSLSVTAPESATTGSSVDLSATVNPSNAVGSVQFTDDGATIGSPVAVVNGVATLSHTFTSAGGHSVGADFVAGAGFTNSSAEVQSVTVADPDVETSLSVTVPASATTGESVSLSAQVTPATAQGSVQFKVNGSPVGSPVPVTAGAATLPHTFDAAGSFAVTAEFTGAAGFTSSSAQAQNVTVSVPVVPDEDTTITVTAPSTAETGQQVTLSVAVSPVPTGGTVQFSVAGTDVGAPVSLDGSGQASMPYTFGAAGSFSVAAVYSGTTGFAGSTAAAHTVVVSDPAPVDVATATLVGVPESAITGAPTTLSVTVQAQSGSAVPTGSVQFRDNGNPIGSPVVLENGSATVTHNFGSAGTHQITAEYLPGAGFLASTSTQYPVAVSAPNPSDVVSSILMSSAQSTTVGTAFTLEAQVTGAQTLPGTVQFFDGGVEIGSPVAVVDGVATIVHTFTSTGPHHVHAVYSGGTGVAGSTSPVQVLDVSEAGGGTGGAGSLDFGSLGSSNGFRFGF